MGEYVTSHREFILAPLHCILRYKPSLLFIPTARWRAKNNIRVGQALQIDLSLGRMWRRQMVTVSYCSMRQSLTWSIVVQIAIVRSLALAHEWREKRRRLRLVRHIFALPTLVPRERGRNWLKGHCEEQRLMK